MRVALTGTPGTGKTEAANLLEAKGYNVISVKELAERFNAALKDGEEIEIDVEALASAILEAVAPDSALTATGKTTILEGHLAHLLPCDACIVLRCNPNVLRGRLEARRYTEKKVRENLEAEAVDLILIEALEQCKNVFEIDISDLMPKETAEAIEKIINGGGDCFPPGKVDWSQVVMDWY